MCAKWIAREKKLQMWHMFTKNTREQCMRRLSYLSSCITPYLHIYILFMTVFSALVIYWFNFLRWHSFSRIFIFRSRYITLHERAFPSLYRFSRITCLHGDLNSTNLQTKMFCVPQLSAISHVFRRVLYHFVFTTYRAEIFASAEYLRYGYYSTSLSYIAEHGVDHPALLSALRFILSCQTRTCNNLVSDTVGVDINKFYAQIRDAPCIITILLPYLNIIYHTTMPLQD